MILQPRLQTLPPSVRSRPARKAALLRRAFLLARLEGIGAGPRLRRGCDVLVGLLGLLLAAPLLAVAAAAIKLTSAGPVFYCQQRVGLRGRIFRLWKLRTMVNGADDHKALLAGGMDGPRFKLERDPRVTAVGRLLRRSSMDELPQFVNVLLGDMTLIGPRPPLWSEVVEYDARALRRLEVPPGLTCLWQVRGRSDLSFEEQVALDLEYIDRVGVGGELRILLETIPAVLTGRGAY